MKNAAKPPSEILKKREHEFTPVLEGLMMQQRYKDPTHASLSLVQSRSNEKNAKGREHNVVEKYKQGQKDCSSAHTQTFLNRMKEDIELRAQRMIEDKRALSPPSNFL